MGRLVRRRGVDHGPTAGRAHARPRPRRDSPSWTSSRRSPTRPPVRRGPGRRRLAGLPGLRPRDDQPGVLRLAAALAAGRGLVVRVARPGRPGGRERRGAGLLDRRAGRRPHRPTRTGPSRWWWGRSRTREPAGLTRDRYLAAVEQVIGRIHWGDFYQLNLCIRLHARGEPVRLRRSSPRWRRSCSRRTRPWSPDRRPTPDLRTVASFSPELFLRVRGREVVTAPIKGTAPRGPDGSTAAGLRASAKDAAENIMIVDLMRNDLSRVCRPGSVAVPELLGRAAAPGGLASGLHRAGRADRRGHHLGRAGGDLSARVGHRCAQARCPDGHRGDRGGGPRAPTPAALGLVSPVAGTELNVMIRTFELTGDATWSSGWAVASRWTACRSGSGTSACTRRLRWSRAAGSSLDPELVDEPGPPDPALTGPGCSSRSWPCAGGSSGWPRTWPGWTGPAASSTGWACPTIWPPPCRSRLRTRPGRRAARPAGDRPAARPRLPIGIEVAPAGAAADDERPGHGRPARADLAAQVAGPGRASMRPSRPARPALPYFTAGRPGHRDLPRQPVLAGRRRRLVYAAAGRAGAARGHPAGGDRPARPRAATAVQIRPVRPTISIGRAARSGPAA